MCKKYKRFAALFFASHRQLLKQAAVDVLERLHVGQGHMFVHFVNAGVG